MKREFPYTHYDFTCPSCNIFLGQEKIGHAYVYTLYVSGITMAKLCLYSGNKFQLSERKQGLSAFKSYYGNFTVDADAITLNRTDGGESEEHGYSFVLGMLDTREGILSSGFSVITINSYIFTI